MKILVCGLAGAGKTTLAQQLAQRLGAVYFNADRVRQTISKDLDFSEVDRQTQAYRMSVMCDIVNDSGYHAVADFICPTQKTRAIFNADFTIWMDTIKASRFEDTNQLFQPLSEYDLRLTDFNYDLDAVVQQVKNG